MNGHRCSLFGLALSFSLLAGIASGQTVSPAEKLAKIIVPRVEMTEAPLADALEFLRIRSADLDTTVPEGRPGRGLNIVLKDPDGAISEKRVSLTLNRVPLKTVLDYITRFSGATYRVDANVIVVGKSDDVASGEAMILPPRLQGGTRVVFERLRDTRLPEISIQDATLEETLQFFRAASARKSADGKTAHGLNFVVKNPEKPLPTISLNLKDIPVGTALRYACELSGVVYTVHPNAVVIGKRDQLLPKPVDPGAHAYGRSGVRSGGARLAAKLKGLVIPTVELSNATLDDALDLVRVSALNAERAAGIENPKGINIVNLAQDNTQRISLSLADMPAWELMSYIVGLTDTEFRVESLAVLVDWKLPRRSTAEKKPDGPVLEVPQVPGLEEPTPVLQVPIVPFPNREARPLGLGGFGGLNFPIAPTTPTAFDVRNVGVTMETEPVIGNDGYSIDLNIAADVVEFEGFLNYGSPIRFPWFR